MGFTNLRAIGRMIVMDEVKTREKMTAVLELVRGDVGSVRTGRANVSMVENIMVEAYGGTQKLRVMELASITTPDPMTILIEPWDKSIIGEIKKGIEIANLGFSPSLGESAIRISLPPMTLEDREKYVKLLKTKIENGRVMVRQIRGDVMHDIKSAFEKKEISEDEKFGQEKKLQELTDEFVGKIEEVGKIKEKELLS